MLSQLTIQNFGLIDRLSIEFDDKLNILTGETGAGKSIIIDALRYVLGERMSSSQVRDASLPCIVEAVFELPQKELRKSEIFADYLSKDEPTLIINRAYFSDGRNKIKVNGFNVTVAQLKEIGDHLVDFHGAHDHQMLLSTDSHLGILDRLTQLTDLKNQYSDGFKEYATLKRELCDLEDLASSREREADMLGHQVKELEQVPLNEEQYEQLKQEQIKINNAEKLNEAASQIVQLLDGDDATVSERLRSCFSPMRALNQTDEKTQEFMDQLDQVQQNNDQLILDLKDYLNGLSFQGEEANEINERCNTYEDIIRKYGPTLQDARDFYAQAKKRYDLLNNLEENDAQLRARISKEETKLLTTAQKMTKERQKTSLHLKKTIEKELSELGIKHVEFESRLDKGDLMAHGQDNVSFFISPNAGESLKPLAEIVSSGEAARVMLALKKALMDVDPIPVLIFDEIDAQIGGRLGTITGKKLREISRKRQVILITHLPQIASFADQHYQVAKSVQNGRAITSVSPLDAKARVDEIAKMMSGENESHVSIRHAKDMLAKAQ